MVATAESAERFLTALHKAVFVIDRSADRVLKEHDSGTFTQLLILMAVSKCPGTSQQQIAEFMDLTPAAVSRQIDTLHEAKLIERNVDPQNRRSHTINLTEAGMKRLGSMKNLLLTSFASETNLDTSELENVVHTLEKVIAIMSPDTCPTTK